MKFQTIAAVFVLMSILMLGMAYLGEGWLVAVVVAFTLSGIAVAVGLAIRCYIYSSVLLGFHVGMAAFTTWVFINRKLVVHEEVFVFSAFTDANLQWAIVTLVTASLAVFLPWVVLARDAKKLLQNSVLSLAYELLGHLGHLPLAGFQLAIIGSFILGVLFFITNTSVFDISYPLQSQTQWLPEGMAKIPVFLALGALGFAYVRWLQRKRSFVIWLLIAKVDFLIVTILMLLLIGSRGLFTFLWLGFGVFEFVLWNKRRGSLAWGMLFVVLAWFAYQSWPYMRVNLSQLPADEVLVEALRIGLGLGDAANLAYTGEDQIRLNNINMIGASLFHLLYVIQLIQDGISINSSTFVNLIQQLLPSWLDGVLWTRPLNDNWLLANYYYHGGGFLLVANAYWNGGLWVALLFMVVMSAIFVGFDRHLRRPDAGLLYRMAYWLWLPVMIVQLGYGIQGMMRVVELLMAVILLERFLRKHRVRGRTSLLGVRTASQASPDHSTGDLS